MRERNYNYRYGYSSQLNNLNIINFRIAMYEP